MSIETAIEIWKTPNLDADRYRSALESMIEEYKSLLEMVRHGDEHLLPGLEMREREDVRNRMKWAERMENVIDRGR